ncbi:MAG: hypothetical protein JWM21_2989 [Acidobacteria bacterium]|nr:hypothetical protein [Acidobacteriota bacterium]
MRDRNFKPRTGVILICIAGVLAAASLVLAQQNRTPRPQSDLKITYKVSMNSAGNSMPASESTSMIKGVRERTEDHRGYYDSVSIMQCDLKRTIQLNDKTRKYIVNTMQDSEASSSPAAPATRPSSAGPSRRGGVVTYITSSRDTGERKEMFGFTARHVKTATRIESSPDACNPQKQRFEQDGWYIDLNFGLSCDLGHAQMVRPPQMPTGGCQDRTQFRREGTARTGFPLSETTTIYDQNDQPSFSSTKEVVELSRQPLDAALFDIPSGYSEAGNWQELNGQPDANALMAEAMGRNRPATESPERNRMSAATESKRPGTIRIGVVQINNRTNNSVSTEGLRERLISSLGGGNVEAVPLNASSTADADAEAKAKQCDFVLYTDIAVLKLSAAKAFGGMLGRATGVGSGSIGKTEAKVEFKLIPVGETSPRLQSTSSGKEEGDDASAGAAIDAEAKAVSAASKKRGLIVSGLGSLAFGLWSLDCKL